MKNMEEEYFIRKLKEVRNKYPNDLDLLENIRNTFNEFTRGELIKIAEIVINAH